MNLPPGWRLFHASGVDAVSSTWVNEWSLLDLFLVLMISMSAWRIWGAVWGGVGLFVVGAVTSRFTARPWWFAGGRQLLFGAIAAAATYLVGSLIGVSAS